MGVFDFISDAYNTVADAASATVEIVSDVASTTVDAVSDATSSTIDVISDAVSTTVDVIGDVASTAVDIVGNTTSATAHVISDAVSTVDVVGDVASTTVDIVGDVVGTAVDYAVENPLTSIATVTAIAATGGVALGAVAGASVVTGASASVMGFAATTSVAGTVTGATVAGSTTLLTSAAVVAAQTTPITLTIAKVALATHATKHVGEYIIDEMKGRVLPVRGSVVYCDLTLGNGIAEHTGIYIGNDKIVHLNRHGFIEAVSPKQFISGPTTGSNIYVSCEGESAVGCDEVADFAELMIGQSRDYNVLIDNCHQFTAGCLIGNSENPNNFLWFLKDEAKKRLGADNWRLWDKNYW